MIQIVDLLPMMRFVPLVMRSRLTAEAARLLNWHGILILKPEGECLYQCHVYKIFIHLVVILAMSLSFKPAVAENAHNFSFVDYRRGLPLSGFAVR